MNLLRVKRAREARNSLYAFARFMAPLDYTFNWHHELLYEYLQAFADGQLKRLIVQMPPGHGKSEGVSRNLPAYLLGRNPDERVLACSYTGDLGSEMNRDVQKIIDSERYGCIFPKTQLNSRNVRALAGSARRNSSIFDVVGWRGFYKSAGVGQGIVGRRFDKGLIDDPIKDRETANSPTMREAMWRWFTGVFLTRQAKDAGICITLTRWHEDDLVGRILQREPGKWEVLTLPAISTNVQAHPRDPRKPNEALWPWFKNLGELQEQREIEPRDFAALYQQEPRAEGAQEWPSDWFDGIFFDEWPADVATFLRVLALDPSKGKQDKSGDYSCWLSLGVDRSTSPETLWVDADMSNTRPVEPSSTNPHSIVGDGYDIMQRWRPAAVLIETNGFQELVASAFWTYCIKRQTLGVPIYTLCNTEPKVQRIRQLGPYLAQRRIRVRNTPGGRLLVQQLKDFPNGEHDDGPDGLKLAEVMADWLINGEGSSGQPRPLVANG